MAVRISILGDQNKTGNRASRKREGRELESLLRRVVIPALAAPAAHPFLPSSYPWCFVISPKSPKDKYCQTGAFFIDRDRPDDHTFQGLYTRRPLEWFEKNVQSSFHIAFWQSRILASLNKRDESADYSLALKEWVISLQRYYSPFWEKFALSESYRFRSKADDLLAGCNDVDSHIRSDHGVDIMPWKEWPACIKMGQYVWLWRQSRHGKIIDSMKISLLGDETNSVC